MTRQRVTRLAPSPTGALHLGNARTFLINWALARQSGWQIVLRIDDLDGPRVKQGAAEQAIDILSWLGLDWDDGPFYQRGDLAPYRAALDELDREHLTYRCTCSRKEIASAITAPHKPGHELRYPGTCRVTPPGEGAAAIRVKIPNEPVSFEDQHMGRQSVNVQQQVGDFVVATKAGLPAYQLAVVIDDARQAVTDVVRGDDLIDSTARQIWLQRFLDLGEPPRYTHLPLVLGPDGRRMAKRHGDTRIAMYRERGCRAEHIVGLLAFWCGIIEQRGVMSAHEFAAEFDLQRLTKAPVTWNTEDETWLSV